MGLANDRTYTHAISGGEQGPPPWLVAAGLCLLSAEHVGEGQEEDQQGDAEAKPDTEPGAPAFGNCCVSPSPEQCSCLLHSHGAVAAATGVVARALLKGPERAA